MWKSLGLLGGLTMGWWGLLWLVLPRLGWLNWQSVSPTAILLAHLAPPAMLSAAIRVWSHLKEARAKLAEQQQAAAEEDERQASRDAARERHYAALRERQQAASCRWLWARALPVKDAPEWTAELAAGCAWSEMDRETLERDDTLAVLRPHVVELLSDLYLDAGGAAWLPLLVEPIPTLSGVEQLTAFKQWQLEAAQTALGDDAPTLDCRFLPGSGLIADRARLALQQAPELPGVAVLAADAPWAQAEEDDDWNPPDAAETLRRKWLGQPGMACVALLFLRDDLPPPASASAEEDAADPYQPYWEKDFSRGAGDWGGVPARWQPQLAALPHLAALAQACQTETPQDKALQLARGLQPVMDNALVNARLLDYPFSPEDAKPENDQAAATAWLVHNSGEIDVGGVRLAALAGSLSRHQVDLHPIDEASNLVREWGDVGAAFAALQAAVAVAHCARLQAPAVITQFSQDHVAVAIARPFIPEEETA